MIFTTFDYFSAQFNPIQDGRLGKKAPTSFSPITSTNVGISHQNFLAFRLNTFVTLV